MDEIYFLRRCSNVEYVEFDLGSAKENPTPSTRTRIVMDGLESPWKSAEQNVPMARQNQRWWQVAPGCSLHISTHSSYSEKMCKKIFFHVLFPNLVIHVVFFGCSSKRSVNEAIHCSCKVVQVTPTRFYFIVFGSGFPPSIRKYWISRYHQCPLALIPSYSDRTLRNQS